MFRPVLLRFRGKIILYALFGVACAAASIASVRLFQILIDRLAGLTYPSEILPILLGYGAVSLTEYVLNYLEEYPYNQLRDGMYQFIRVMALKKVSHIDYAAYQEVGTGNLVQRVENGAAAGRDILFQFYLNVFTQLLPSALLSIAFIGVYDWRIMLGAAGGYLIVFAITKLLINKLYSIKEETLISQEWLSKTYVRAFMEMVVFRVNRRFRKEIELADAAGRKLTDAFTRIKMLHELFFAAFAILVLLIKIGIILFSIREVVGGSMTVGVLIALLTLVDRVYQPIAIFNVEYVDYQLNRAAWNRFTEFLSQPDDKNLLGGDTPRVSRGELRFEGVSFSYGNRPILMGIDLTFPAGKTTALLGRSGAGKSTILSLAMGLIKPTKGRVLLDGQDMGEMDLNQAYRHIAYISQDAPVFDGTIRENILFDEEAPDDAVWQALDQAQLSDLVKSMADGLDTAIGEHGVKLSGGEKQRLAFARIFHQRPEIIVLDEPTSALDKDTEAEIVRTLRNALPDRTILLIAHSKEAISYADFTVRLEDGKVF